MCSTPCRWSTPISRLLPRWRGAAPVERAILAGDAETGVCLMKLDEGLDTGPVYDRVTTPIGDDETALELRARFADLGARLVVDSLGRGLGEPVAQLGEATYAAKIEPADLELDFSHSAVDAEPASARRAGVDDGRTGNG